MTVYIGDLIPFEKVIFGSKEYSTTNIYCLIKVTKDSFLIERKKDSIITDQQVNIVKYSILMNY